MSSDTIFVIEYRNTLRGPAGAWRPLVAGSRTSFSYEDEALLEMAGWSADATPHVIYRVAEYKRRRVVKT